MAEAVKRIPVQVCYARPERQWLLDLEVPEGSTLEQAVAASGILLEAPEIDLENARTGIFGKPKALDAVVQAHDRIEIYRPLIADPKESRRRRAELARRRKGG